MPFSSKAPTSTARAQTSASPRCEAAPTSISRKARTVPAATSSTGCACGISDQIASWLPSRMRVRSAAISSRCLIPAISLPVLNDEGLPLGLQITGFINGDAEMFAAAASIKTLFR